MKTVVVLGGYGAFGARIVRGLADLEVRIIVAGRRQASAERTIAGLGDQRAALIPMALDIQAGDFPNRLEALAPWLVIDTCGPFQSRDHSVASACIDAGSHYLDLADAREFVAGIAALDDAAKSRGVAAVSGASSVPGISSAAADRLADDFSRIDAIEVAIAPGNRIRPGVATTRAILGYLGQPFTRPRHDIPTVVYGWTGTQVLRFPQPVGRRRAAHCDVPDLALFADRYGAASVAFRAGQELALLHYGMVGMAWLRRTGLGPNWARFSAFLHRVGCALKGLGSNHGGMLVCLRGLAADGRPRLARWTLVARDGYGPELPTLPARLLARRWLTKAPKPGARACLGETTLADIERAADPAFVSTRIDTEPAPLVVYDGACVLCNGAVDFLIRNDPEGQLYLAHAQSELGRRAMSDAGEDPRRMETMVLVDAAGTATRSEAAWCIASHLQRPARWLTLLRVVPRGIRDSIYDLIAARRYRWFGKRESCRLPTAAARRFVGEPGS